MANRKYSKVQRKRVLRIAKPFALCASLLAIWYLVMFLVGWYDAGFHIAATAFSVLLVNTGRSWGIVGKLAN